MSDRKKIGLGILAFAPLVITIVFFVFFFGFFFEHFRSMSQSSNHGNTDLATAKSMFSFMLFLMFTSLVHLAALIYFLVHASRDKQASSDSRVLWIVLLALVSSLAFPIYWYVRIWTRKEEPQPEYLGERSN